jgi:taurine dioxygenase
MESTAMAYTITPLSLHTGAEIRGLDLTKPVDPETRASLNRAFATHHVLVVRDQTGLPRDVLRLERADRAGQALYRR